MERIELKLTEEQAKELDSQRIKYGINNRSDYLRMLIKMDIMSNIVALIKQCNDEGM